MMLAESSNGSILSWQSADLSLVDVAPFYLIQPLFLLFHLSRFSFYVTVYPVTYFIFLQEDKKDDKKEKKEDKKEDKDLSSRQAIAVLGIALIAMGEEIGSEMAFRTFGHLVSKVSF